MLHLIHKIKIFKDRIYVVDFENTLRAYSINDGKEIWNSKNKKFTHKVSKKTYPLVILDEKIYFNNSIGMISVLLILIMVICYGKLPTQNSLAFDTGFFLKTSDIVADKNDIIFSNNQNEFFSLDITTGNLKLETRN